MSGATRFTKNPKELLIAETTAEVIEASGVFKRWVLIANGQWWSVFSNGKIS